MAYKLKTGPKLLLVALLAGGIYLGWRQVEVQVACRPSKTVGLTPADLKLAFEKVGVRTPDGLDLRGWFVPDGGTASVTTQPTVLYFHDAGQTISDGLGAVRLFHELHFNVFLVDYRGFGESEGESSVAGLGLDALATYFHLIERRHVPPPRILLYGEGLGAAVAVELATKVKAAGLITEAAFTSLTEKAEYAHPHLPWNLVFRHQLDTIRLIKTVNMPVLLIHSDDDREIPFRHSERLFEAASNPKNLLKIHGEHGVALIRSADLCRESIGNFARRYAAADGSAASVKSARVDPWPP